MFFQAGRDRQNIRIENDVVRRDAGAFRQEPISAGADIDSPLKIIGLPGFIERHHDDRGAVPFHQSRLPQKFFLAVLQADRIHDRFSLDAFQSRFDHAPLRAVNHHRHPRDLWLTPDEMEELRHRRFRVDHSLVHVDVENVGAAVYLLPRYDERALEIVGQNQFRKLRRARDVGPLTHDHESGVRSNVQRLEPGEL